MQGIYLISGVRTPIGKFGGAMASLTAADMGVVAAKTILPVLGVPVPSTTLGGADALLSIVQMPRGVPVGTLAIGKSGAANAALLAIAIMSGKLVRWSSGRLSTVSFCRTVELGE